MKQAFKRSFEQALPILISAGIAAGLAFFQTLGAEQASCLPQTVSVAETGFLGAVVKAIHSAYKAGSVIV